VRHGVKQVERLGFVTVTMGPRRASGAVIADAVAWVDGR
jgi:hypothetical protein